MGFSRASIKYRPLCIGSVVRGGFSEDLVKAAGINSLLWGGVYNPILPISPQDDKFSERLIDLFAIDILYAVSETPEIQKFIAKYPFLRDPRHYAENIFHEDWHSKKKVVAFLDAKNIVNLFWDKDYKNKPTEYKSNFTLVNWENDDPLANSFALQFGFFPKEPEFKWDYKRIFLKGLRANEITISKSDNVTINPTKSFGPIDTTGAELSGYPTGHRNNSPGLYIGDSNDFYDLLSFWNIRASGINVKYLPMDYLERVMPFAQSFLNFLNGLPDRNPSWPDHPTIYHRFKDKELIKNLSTKFQSKKPISWQQITEHSWNGTNIQPDSQVFKWQTVTTRIEPSYDKYIVNIELPEKKFLVDEEESNLQQMGIIIEPYGDFNHPGYTLKLPKIRQLNEFYSREIEFDPWAIRAREGGFSKIISCSDDSIDLYPISKQLLIEKTFEIAGIKAQLSQPGLITRKLLDKTGGLEDARVFKIKGVRKILQDNSPNTVITRGEATRIINENDFAKHKGLYIEARQSLELGTNETFNYLLKKDFFRAGLELICNECRLKNWITLKAIDDIWVCEYCGNKNQTSLDLKNRGDWKFRKSGLFAKDNHQEGAIPTLLTLLAMKRVFDHDNFTYSMALELRGEGIKDCETDLCVLNHKNDEIDIAIGECKSDGGKFTEDDCNKLKKVAQKLSAFDQKIKSYIIFAKTSDSFLPEEIQMFSELSKDVELVLFTNKEMEPYHIYWLEKGGVEEDVPEKYPHSLHDLARNSFARYLKKYRDDLIHREINDIQQK